MSEKISVILLAAGGSSRLGRPKQLVHYGGKSLLRIAVEAAAGSYCESVTVVLGATDPALLAELEGLSVGLAFNPEWQTGIGSSIRCGITAVHPDTTAVVLMLCDQPRVTSELINSLITAHQTTGAPMVASEYADTLGVPALFTSQFFHDLAALPGDEGAKKLIARYSDRVGRIPFPEAEIDIDTPEDVESLTLDHA